MSGISDSARSTAAQALPEEPLETRLVRVKLRDLKLLEGHQNARYMRAAQFERLVMNIKRDGVLTSAPLVYRGIVRSGNHRVQAGIEAGVEEADAIEILGDVSEDRLLAIQLSHNAITGEDDPTTLATLWKALPFDEKRYSGLTDEAIGTVKELDVDSLGIGGPEQEEMVFLFLPEEAGAFHDLVKKIEARIKRPPIYACARPDFDKFFDAIVGIKKQLNVLNAASVVATMAQLALERLDQLAAEAKGEGDNKAA